MVGHAVLPGWSAQILAGGLRLLPVETVLRVAGLAAIDRRRLRAGSHAAHSPTHAGRAGLGLRREREEGGDETAEDDTVSSLHVLSP
ncbi:MAG: hypothetical protein IPL11_15140 [Candidatus Accumulibacter sp.]|nr:hypothetical protein [Accumulibacter sp.]